MMNLQLVEEGKISPGDGGRPPAGAGVGRGRFVTQTNHVTMPTQAGLLLAKPLHGARLAVLVCS